MNAKNVGGNRIGAKATKKMTGSKGVAKVPKSLGSGGRRHNAVDMNSTDGLRGHRRLYGNR